MKSADVVSIIEELAPQLSGGKPQATTVVADIVSDLAGKFDTHDILQILAQQVEKLKKNLQNDQLNQVKKDLEKLLGSKEKADEAIDETVNELQGQYDRAGIINSLKENVEQMKADKEREKLAEKEKR